jgi:hypothetical protein
MGDPIVFRGQVETLPTVAARCFMVESTSESYAQGASHGQSITGERLSAIPVEPRFPWVPNSARLPQEPVVPDQVQRGLFPVLLGGLEV